MVIPIWSADWEIECCQPDAEVGQAWAVPVKFVPGTSAWWEAHGGSATAEQRSLGTITVSASVDRVSGNGASIRASAGALRFRMTTSPPPGPIVGRLFVDAHPDEDDDIHNDEVTVSGTVTRVQFVPLRFERQGQMFLPVEQVDAFDTASTLRRTGSTPSVPNETTTELVHSDILLWLDVP